MEPLCGDSPLRCAPLPPANAPVAVAAATANVTAIPPVITLRTCSTSRQPPQRRLSVMLLRRQGYLPSEEVPQRPGAIAVTRHEASGVATAQRLRRATERDGGPLRRRASSSGGCVAPGSRRARQP